MDSPEPMPFYEVPESQYSQIIVEERDTVISGSSIMASSQYFESGFKPNCNREFDNALNIIRDLSPERPFNFEDTHNKENMIMVKPKIVKNITIPWKHKVEVKHTIHTAKKCRINEEVEPVVEVEAQPNKMPYLLAKSPEPIEEQEVRENEKELTPLQVENAMIFDLDNLWANSGVQKKLNFSNCTLEMVEEEDEKVIQIERYLFGTDLWFSGLGMNINQLWDPNDQIIKEGELLRYKPGLDRVFISRWCQLTTKVFRVYKNQMFAKGFLNKPILAIPLYVIENVKKSKFKVPKSSKLVKDSRVLKQNQFEIVYKDEILSEILMEFLESKGIIDNDHNGETSERKQEDSYLADKLNILKKNMVADEPFKVESKMATLNNCSSWSNREGEWFLAEKRLLFTTARAHDLSEWKSLLKKVFSNPN